MRISDEGGRSASARNFGRLALSVIPAALGGAACLWIFAAFGWLDLTQEMRRQQRAMQSVGLAVMPREPIRVLAHDDLCLKVESAYMDGDRLQFYARNTCSHWLKDPNFSYHLKAGDGTVIGSKVYAFDGNRQIGPQERREQWLGVSDDGRTASVDLRVFD